MKNIVQDIRSIIKGNRDLIKKLLKINNLIEISIPEVSFQRDTTEYYFYKVSLSDEERLRYHYKYRGPNNKTYYGWYSENSICEYTYEENEILLYIDTYFSLIKKCTYDLGKYLL